MLLSSGVAKLLGKSFVVKLAGCDVDLLRRSISTPAGKDILLTHGEFSILVGLIERRGQPVPRNVLLTEVSNGEHLRTIDTLMVRLRRKLARSIGRIDLIQTVYGEGYRLAEDFELLASNAS